MQNIESKAELRDIEAARAQCSALGANRLGVLRQTDTYFRLADGRLKRREAPGEPTVWIFYHRADRTGPRMSNYSLLTNEQACRRWGVDRLPVWRVIVKSRELWMLGNVRIHLDEVDDIGAFIEFEAMVSREFDVKACYKALARLREAFGPIMGEAISVSYCDMLDDEPAQSEPAERPEPNAPDQPGPNNRS